MRLFVTALALAVMSCALTPAETPPTLSQAPLQRLKIRQAAPPGNPKPASVPPSTPIATLQGICGDRKVKNPCQTVITREDLDRFVSGFGPEVSETARGRLAVQYAGTLAFSSLAEQQGLQLNPALAKELEFQLRLVRMHVLASAFLQNLQQQNLVIPPADVQKYYDEHRSQYEQAQIRRLSVPVTVPTESGRPLDHAAIKSELEDLRKRAAAGADLTQLQLDAYQDLHIQATPPPLNVSTVRRGSVQGDEAKAFDLNPGEISPVLDLPAAFALVKLESKDPLPLESVRPEIEAAVRQQRMQDEVRKLTQKMSAQFNLPYLGLSSQPDIFGLTAIMPATSRAGMGRTPRIRAGAEITR